MIYNVLLKSRLQQKAGETEAEYRSPPRGTGRQEQERQVDRQTATAGDG